MFICRDSMYGVKWHDAWWAVWPVTDWVVTYLGAHKKNGDGQESENDRG